VANTVKVYFLQYQSVEVFRGRKRTLLHTGLLRPRFCLVTLPVPVDSSFPTTPSASGWHVSTKGIRSESGMHPLTHDLLAQLFAGRLGKLFDYALGGKEDMLMSMWSRIVMVVLLIAVKTRTNPKTQVLTERGMDK
jgi:hypothetical protein